MNNRARPGWREPATALARSVRPLGAEHAAAVEAVVERAGGQPKAFTPDEFTMAIARCAAKVWNKLDLAKGDAALSMSDIVVGVQDEVGALHAAARKVQGLVAHLSVDDDVRDVVALALGRGVLDYLDADAAWREERRRMRTGLPPDPDERPDGPPTELGPYRYSSGARALIDAVAVAVAAFYVERADSREKLDVALNRATRELVGLVAVELYSGSAEVTAALDGARRIVELDML